MRTLQPNSDLKPFSSTSRIQRAPYDGRELARVTCLDIDGARRALARAHRLHRQDVLPKATRIAVLERAAVLLSDEAERVAREAAQEGGKPLTDSRVEVARAIDGLKWCAHAVRSEVGELIPTELNAASADRIARTELEPLGPVLAFSAFNHPVNLIVHQVGTAIAAGCPVVVKPAEKTPISCHNVVELLEQAGLPKGWCQIIHLDSFETAEALVADPRNAYFSFIGSAAVGWRLRSLLAPGTRCALEHGGVAPAIIAADADTDDLLPRLARAAFYHSGQVCVSLQRIYVHRSIARDLANGLAEQARGMTYGDPLDGDVAVGPIITPEARRRIHAWVERAGGELLCGGEAIEPSGYMPTVIYAPKADSELCTEEVFGPVVAVIPFDEIDDAIDAANALPYIFQAAVCSQDIDTCLSTARRLRATCVMVNDHTAFRVDWMPFGGHGHSGMGVGGMRYALREQSREKLTVLRIKGAKG